MKTHPMTREEIARVIAQSKSAALSEAIDAFQELARETEAFSDLQVVTVYLKHVRAVADSQLAKLHQDAGNGEISKDGPYAISADRKWLARQLLDSQLSETEALSIVRNFPADALERGSQVGDGWVIVPREPTEKMKDAHYAAHATSGRVFASAEEVYRAMLAAAPAHGGGE